MSGITNTEVNRVVKAARRIDPEADDDTTRRQAVGRAEQASIPEQAARLRLAINRTARRLRQSAGSELGASATAALATIERGSPMTPSALAAAEGIKRPTATKIVARLEKAGFVSRAADPGDRRCSLISITPAGKRELAAMRNRKDAYLAQRLEALGERDVATLRRAAAILERMLEEERS